MVRDSRSVETFGGILLNNSVCYCIAGFGGLKYFLHKSNGEFSLNMNFKKMDSFVSLNQQ